MTKIVLSASRDIPLNKLVLSQANVRRIKAGVSVDELAAGAWVWKDAYEAGEAAQALFRRRYGPAMRAKAGTRTAMLAMLASSNSQPLCRSVSWRASRRG